MMLGLPGLTASPAAWVARGITRRGILRAQDFVFAERRQQQQWRLLIRCAATDKDASVKFPSGLEGLAALIALSGSGKMIGKDGEGNVVIKDYPKDESNSETSKTDAKKQTNTNKLSDTKSKATDKKDKDAEKLDKKYIRSEKVKKLPTPAPRYSKAARRFYNERFRESERLSKVMAAAGVASRRACEEVIFAGKVTVNGKVCKLPQTPVDPLKDIIYINGKSLPRKLPPKLVFALYKPKGYICSTAQDNKKSVLMLFDDFYKTWVQKNPGITRPRFFTVGRLDVATSGLLLVTNDGELANKVSHPSSGITKEYIATVGDKVTKRQLQKITDGTVVDGVKCVPLSVEHLHAEAGDTKQRLRIVVGEGRNHEVRNLVENAKLQVHSLKRVRVGGLRLPAKLSVGKYIQLTEAQAKKVIEEDPVMMLSKREESPVMIGQKESPVMIGQKERPLTIGQKERPLTIGQKERPLKLLDKGESPVNIASKESPVMLKRVTKQASQAKQIRLTTEGPTHVLLGK